MKKVGIDHLTDRHLLLFGTIIQWFARYELLMQEIMASIAGTDSGAVMLLTRGLDFSSKRRTLLDLLRRSAIPLDQYDRLNEYLTVPHTLTPLRDDIAHSAWIPGPATNSIQPDWILRIPPGVRPLHGKGLFERKADTFSYSLESLGENVATLAANYARLSDYLQEIGLVRG
jgi:hypothetical protein